MSDLNHEVLFQSRGRIRTQHVQVRDIERDGHTSGSSQSTAETQTGDEKSWISLFDLLQVLHERWEVYMPFRRFAPAHSTGARCRGMLKPKRLANQRIARTPVGKRRSSVWARKGRAEESLAELDAMKRKGREKVGKARERTIVS